MTSAARNEASAPAQNPEDLRATLTIAAKTGGLLQIGDFEIDGDGRLRPRAGKQPIAFGFSYRGLDFMAEVRTGGGNFVHLTAELGKLPYRAEAGGRRDAIRRVVDATTGLPCGQIEISDGHDMHLRAEIAAPAPLTPASLMAALVAMLLDFKPYIDLLHEVMLSPVPRPEPEPRRGP